MPTIRKLAKSGAVAKGMITSFPSVTWPAHTSLVTGVQPAKHGVIGNSVWNRKLDRSVVYIGDPELTKNEAVRMPTLYDAAHRAGLTCGSVIWPACNGADSLKWCIPDAGKPELHAKFTTPGFIAELAKEKIDAAKLGEWGWSKEHSTERDVLYTRVTQYLLEKQRANLILVHLITPDGIEHAYGPHTPEAYQSVKESDQRVAEIWQTLEQPEFAGKATLFVGDLPNTLLGSEVIVTVPSILIGTNRYRFAFTARTADAEMPAKIREGGEMTALLEIGRAHV